MSVEAPYDGTQWKHQCISKLNLTSLFDTYKKSNHLVSAFWDNHDFIHQNSFKWIIGDWYLWSHLGPGTRRCNCPWSWNSPWDPRFSGRHSIATMTHWVIDPEGRQTTCLMIIMISTYLSTYIFLFFPRSTKIAYCLILVVVTVVACLMLTPQFHSLLVNNVRSIKFAFFIFLDAFSHHYKRVCPAVLQSVTDKLNF